MTVTVPKALVVSILTQDFRMLDFIWTQMQLAIPKRFYRYARDKTTPKALSLTSAVLFVTDNDSTANAEVPCEATAQPLLILKSSQMARLSPGLYVKSRRADIFQRKSHNLNMNTIQPIIAILDFTD